MIPFGLQIQYKCMMVVQCSWWQGCELAMLQGDHKGTMTFCIDMLLFMADTLDQVKRKNIFFSLFRLHIETSLQDEVSKNITKNDSCYTIYQYSLNS